MSRRLRMRQGQVQRSKFVRLLVWPDITETLSLTWQLLQLPYRTWHARVKNQGRVGSSTREGIPDHQVSFDEWANSSSSVPSENVLLANGCIKYEIGAVLTQEHDEKMFPVCYASKKLSSAERNYSTIKKEYLAVVCCSADGLWTPKVHEQC